MTGAWSPEVRVRYYANPSTPALLPVPAMPGTSVILVEELTAVTVATPRR